MQLSRITPHRLARHAADLGHEAVWKLWPRPLPRTPRTWPIDPDVLARLTVYWPAKPPPGIENWVSTIEQGFRRVVRTETADLPQPRRGVVRFEVGLEGERVAVALDCRDASDLVDEHVDSARVYFKMQHREEGYGLAHVLPAGYVPGEPTLYPALAHLRALRRRATPTYDVYGRFGTHAAQEVRREAVRLLSEQRRFRFEGNLVRIRYGRYLREMSRARLCLDLPGQGDFCFRLVDYLAVGSCVVAVRHGNLLPVALRDGREVAYVRADLSDLLEVCERYLRDEEARERLASSARDYFDRYLHREQLACYYLACLLPELTHGTRAAVPALPETAGA